MNNHTGGQPCQNSKKRRRPLTIAFENAQKMVRVELSTCRQGTTKTEPACNPEKVLESILSSRGYRMKKISHRALPEFFEEVKPQDIDSYGFDVLRAIRDCDIETLRALRLQGRSLKCSNKFGESILHLACRKAFLPVVKFLLDEAQVPLNVKDDMGRSPLHDAFWTPRPSFELVDYLLKKNPDLLLIGDERGHTPLAYARRQDWAKWNEYLAARKDTLSPTLLPRRQVADLMTPKGTSE